MTQKQKEKNGKQKNNKKTIDKKTTQITNFLSCCSSAIYQPLLKCLWLSSIVSYQFTKLRSIREWHRGKTTRTPKTTCKTRAWALIERWGSVTQPAVWLVLTERQWEKVQKTKYIKTNDKETIDKKTRWQICKTKTYQEYWKMEQCDSASSVIGVDRKAMRAGPWPNTNMLWWQGYHVFCIFYFIYCILPCPITNVF